jgi:hypothetical protein
MVLGGGTNKQQAQARDNLFNVTNFGAQGAKGATAGTRGTSMGLAPTQPTKPLGAQTPTGGKTPFGNDKGPFKKMNDNVMNTHQRNVQKNFNTGPNLGKAEKAAPGLSNPFSDGTRQSTLLEVYKTPKESMTGRIANTFQGIGKRIGLFQNSGTVGKGVDQDSLFQDCGRPGSPKKKKMFITSEEK